MAVHEAPPLIERYSYHLGNQLIGKSLLASRIVVQVGRWVKEEACRIREVTTTCSRGYYSVDSNLTSGTINGGRSINDSNGLGQYGAFVSLANPEIDNWSDLMDKCMILLPIVEGFERRLRPAVPVGLRVVILEGIKVAPSAVVGLMYEEEWLRLRLTNKQF